MSGFRVHNTLSRQLEDFQPREAGHARMYTCGPTVYNVAHIGNFRAYVFEDLLRRWLQFKGYRVTQVMNLTDVDDKTIRDSQAAGMPLADYTAQYKQAFFEDMRALNIQPAEHYPAATDHIPEMIALIRTLEEKGYAYRAADGSVYFSIDQWPAYGKLAHLDRTGLRPGVRVATDEYDKDNAARFRVVEGLGRRRWRRVLGDGTGQGPPGLAYRMFGHEPQIPRLEFRHPLWRRG